MSEKNGNLKKGQREKAIARREASLSKKLINRTDNSTQIAFTLYVIAIAAKLATISSSKNVHEQIESFKEIFSIPESEFDKVEGFYEDAVGDKVDATHYAKQLTNLFPNNRLLLEELINDLFIFADADGQFSSEKVQFLKDVVLALKFNDNYFGRALRKHLVKSSADPFKLLNVSQNVSYVDLKKAYRIAIRDCHPDKFSSDDVMQELKTVAEEQFNNYTRAYEAIKLKKGFDKKVTNDK